jgi:hypothetical protein
MEVNQITDTLYQMESTVHEMIDIYMANKSDYQEAVFCSECNYQGKVGA